ncbi:MAG: AAA family ATPase, partial [Fusobacteriaceae bacterium]
MEILYKNDYWKYDEKNKKVTGYSEELLKRFSFFKNKKKIEDFSLEELNVIYNSNDPLILAINLSIGNGTIKAAIGHLIKFKNQKRTIKNSKKEEKRDKPLNQILYGPPGTGKTYSSMEKAVEIIMGDQYSEIEQNRDKIVENYKKFIENRQIIFTTFHQSYGYEDFIEGYKPSSDAEFENSNSGSNGNFTLEKGVFKKLCDTAKDIKKITGKKEYFKYNFKENIAFYKMSLGNTQDSSDDIIYENCIENGIVALGWGGDTDYSQCKTFEETKEKYLMANNEFNQRRVSFVNDFKNKIQKGDIVFISSGNYKIRAIGKVTGEYEYKPDSNIGYSHIRKVEWLYEGEIPVEQLYSKNFMQQTLYKLWGVDTVKLREVVSDDTAKIFQKKNYVIIIDEINRGNISKIFGELITLIEEDKRLGEKNEIKVTLPYSKEIFGIPNNVYIIGTMNTADRSIALLDTALRRRFIFQEIMPEERLIDEVIEGTQVNARAIFKVINQRIEALLGRESQIGHSYFMVNNYDEFCDTILNKVIPLLQEYFYFDMEKVKMVL